MAARTAPSRHRPLELAATSILRRTSYVLARDRRRYDFGSAAGSSRPEWIGEFWVMEEDLVGQRVEERLESLLFGLREIE